MPITDAYNNTLGPENLGSIVYEMDGFSGSNLFLMMGDVLIDAAVYLKYNVEQSKIPVYGYAQQYFSFVADGHVMVQGGLAVAFKESAYMLNPIQRFSNFAAKAFQNNGLNGYWNNPRYSQDKDGNIINSYVPQDYTLTEASRKARNKKIAKGNVEQIYDWQQSGESPRQHANFNRLYKELGALEDNAFEDWAEVFEDALWYGSDKNNPLVRNKLYSRNIPENEEIENEDVLQHRRIDQYPPIDLTIVYGDSSRQPTNHTVMKLLDVYFTGQSQTIETEGGPILDNYSFIARTVV